MDISQPVGTEIALVDFGFLTADEIRRLLAKQIINPTVFDQLGHPISGGLYDLALGAFLRNLCATCGLDERLCPGHQGHIELPVPVYNPMFFPQLYVYLRALCAYCLRFRLLSMEVHRYECRLRLIQYGLLVECDELDALGAGSVAQPEPLEQDAENDTRTTPVLAEAEQELRAKRELFVDHAIARALAEGRALRGGVFTASVHLERKKTVHELCLRMVARPKCDNCGMYLPLYRKDGFTKIFETAVKDKQETYNRVKGMVRPDMLKGGANAVPAVGLQLPPVKAKQGSKYVLSTEVRNLLRQVFANEQLAVRLLFHLRPGRVLAVLADMFFLHALVVPATRFRLPLKLGEEVHENFQNELLSKILTTLLMIRDLNELIAGGKEAVDPEQRKILFNRLMNGFVMLQNDVNGFIDATKNQNNQAGKLPTPGIKQALEKKEGLFRKHMMGKRVNYAARLVISPDPMLETNEIGVPPVFAVKLTYPEPVTPHNVAEMRQAVINGPDKWPGATQVQNEDGLLVALAGMTEDQRKAVANTLLTPSSSGGLLLVVNKKVFRHIRNNDVVIMNRQPTLHKALMMGHKVRVLPGEKTLRLHYANTGAYNADFDGDEMNMHFPQNENARAEALNVANTDLQYLTPTLGAPLRGLIQDHILAGVWLTNKDLVFTREQYQQLVYGCMRPEDGHTTHARLVTLPPAFIKPRMLWTGKQVISTVLLNITPQGMPGLNLELKNKVKNEYWGELLEENAVIVHRGLLVCGILDKSQYGALQYGLVHSLHEVYGPAVAGKALSVLGRLFTNYITATAFTCGMDDLRLTAEGNQWRTDILKQSVDVGRIAATEVANLPADSTKARDPELVLRLEEIMRDDNKLGILDAMTQLKVNAITSQVVSRCVPDGTMKRFPYNSMQAMALLGAKGSNVNVLQIMCLLGQQALEGRRVPVMVSGKTLPSFRAFETDARAGGYIKGRFYLGIRPQEYYFHCMAGREGLIDTAVKTLRSGYLQRCLIKQLEGTAVAYDGTVRDLDGRLLQFIYGGDAIDTTKELHMTQFGFCAANYEALLQKCNPGDLIHHLDTDLALLYTKKARRQVRKGADADLIDPVLLVYLPLRHLGAVLEKFANELDEYIELHPDAFSKKALLEKKFRALMQLKYMRLLIAPGEAVGIVAAQLIGEPSTQMTLNTFHFAGHGAANVTLGIPRMREIIMTASLAIKTPQMTLPLLEGVTDEQAGVFCKLVGRVVLLEFIDQVTVTETAGAAASSLLVRLTRLYKVHLGFYTRKEYEEEYDVLQAQVEHTITSRFLNKLEQAIVKEVRKQKKPAAMAVGKPVPRSQTEAAVTAQAAKEVDDDADEERLSANRKQAVLYDGPDDEEVEAMQAASGSSDEGESDGTGSGDESDSDVEMKEEEEEGAPRAKLRLARDREAEILVSHSLVSSFDFDDENGEWCEFMLELPLETEKLLMVNIVEDLCRATVVREIPKIGRCVHPQGTRELTTEGVNFGAMWDMEEFINVNGIRLNDVVAVLKTYGVEAARNTIVNEINNVFGRYAITVLLRHLDLIGDVMTREGTYLAFNRQGMDLATSLFMKMSFETTCGFLTLAVLDSEREPLESPLARVVMGRLLSVGTGLFDVMAKM